MLVFTYAGVVFFGVLFCFFKNILAKCLDIKLGIPFSIVKMF